MKKYLYLCLLFFMATPVLAQQKIKGIAIDTLKQISMQSATVTLLAKSDSSIVGFARTNADGAFTLNVKDPGMYLLLIGFKNYVDYYDQIKLEKNEEKNLGRIPMLSRDQLLKEIVVTRQRAAIKIKGDTTEYVADSFKVRDNASVEELLKKLPGMQVDRNGNITAQGESVEKVLVDGEEFFSDDPKVVTRNLQANAVDKVQVFDKKSDQAQFTGIDDGQKIKTINLQLKEDRKAGYFGKFIAAAGPRIDPTSKELAKNGYFDNQGMINLFKGKRKIAVFEIVSNTGTVGLGWQDRDKFGGGNNTVFDEESGVSFSTNSEENWDGTFDGQGLPKVWTSGAHYSNKWKQDTFHVNSNFRTAKQIVETETNTNTQYLLSDTSFNISKESSNQFSTSIRHRLDGMFEWKIDSSATFKISANGGINHAEFAEQSTSFMQNQRAILLNNSVKVQTSSSDAISNNATAIWRKRLKKKGRTITINVDESAKNSNSSGVLDVINTYAGSTFDSVTNQLKTTASSSLTLDANATYTEPVMKNTFVEFTYGAGIKNNTAERFSYNALAKNVYNTICDSFFSSHYVFNVFTQKASTALKYNYKKMNVSIGMGASQTNFSQKDLFTNTTRTRSFNNLFPKASFTYTMQGHSRFVLRYSGATSQPTIDQIQPLNQNTDPLNIVIGNADLRQSFNNNYSLNFNDYKMLTGVWKYAGINYIQTNDGISTSDSITAAGRRFSKYVNVDGNYFANFWGGMGRKIDRLNLTLGFNLNGAFNNRNNFVNGVKNSSSNNSFGFGLDLNYDKEDKFNLSLNPQIDYNANTSSIGNNINYLTFQLDFNGNVTLPHHFELGSDFNWFLRQETEVFKIGNNIFRWNAYISKKLLKNDQLECRFYVNDILNQNLGYNRVGQSNYITETSYNNIKRYALINIIWNFTTNPITNEGGGKMHFRRRK